MPPKGAKKAVGAFEDDFLFDLEEILNEDRAELERFFFGFGFLRGCLAALCASFS